MTYEAKPMLTVRFTLADGTELARSWDVYDMIRGRVPEVLRNGPPDWLDDAKREWPNPKDPILLTGRVKAGYEDEARAALAWVNP